MDTGPENILHEKKMIVTRPAHLHRIKSAKFAAAQEVLLLSALTLGPDDRTQRQAFSTLMPDIYFLRTTQGYTFKKITTLLRECGFKLTESSVRVYYYELIPKRKKEYIKHAEEKELILSEFIRETEGLTLVQSAEKIIDILKMKRLQAEC